jgi:hypothetical protein
MVNWGGHLQIQGNAIQNAVALNFWNANNPLEQTSNRQLDWKSVTTGGSAGMILALKYMGRGRIKIVTKQGEIQVDISKIGLEPMCWDFGGLQKEINIYRLPRLPRTHQYSFRLPLTNLQPGDNPIYLRMVQEDEHRAWTSPIYLINGSKTHK